MPEGDTLRRLAKRLAPVLVGETVTDIWFRKLRGHRPRVGFRIHRVDAVGKYLRIAFDRRLVLHTHLGMSGAWRITEKTARVSRDPRLRILIETARGRALCFGAPTIFTAVEGAQPDPLAHLGPDLSDDDVDLTKVVQRSRSLADSLTLAEMLLHQRVATGVGNVFKSEALFVAKLFPFRNVADVSDAQLTSLWSIAHEQLVANRQTRTRSTTRNAVDNTFVYGRARLPCRLCHHPIEFSRSGARTARSTYWCPECQPETD